MSTASATLRPPTEAESIEDVLDGLDALVATSPGRLSYAAGTEVFRESDPGQLAYLIEDGYVVVSKKVEGQSIPLATLGPGEIFGEMAVLDGHVRTATARALHDCVLIPITRERIEAGLSSEDPLVELLLRSSFQRLRSVQGHDDEAEQALRQPAAPVRESPPQGLSRVKKRFAENVKLRMELEDAIDRSRMKLVYQPIVSLADGTVAGFEALARWPGAPTEFSAPDRFIPLAEKTGLIVPLGEWILKTGLAALQRLGREADGRGRRSQPLFMSVNVSPEQIARPEDLERLIEVIETSSCSPETLKLELTESAMLRGGDSALETLTRLRDTGASISIDDFGTGYSSLSYLHRFPINVIKIDRSFTNALSDGPNGGRIVSAILSLARELELEAVAEGIEHEEEARWLRERSCRYGQGYLFSRPVELDQALALLGARYI